MNDKMQRLKWLERYRPNDPQIAKLRLALNAGPSPVGAEPLPAPDAGRRAGNMIPMPRGGNVAAAVNTSAQNLPAGNAGNPADLGAAVAGGMNQMMPGGQHPMPNYGGQPIGLGQTGRSQGSVDDAALQNMLNMIRSGKPGYKPGGQPFTMGMAAANGAMKRG